MEIILPEGLLKSCINKKTYRSDQRAQVAALRSCLKFEKPMRVYKCPYCRFFHLTSQVPALEASHASSR